MKLEIQYNQAVGKLGPMNAVNNGPVVPKNGLWTGNLQTYKEANIPYARVHDASFCNWYGGEHSVDVHMIFPDFSRDPDDPTAYDFHLTDEYMADIEAAGAKVFYRLGSKIEHETKKYGTVPPADFRKWAVICEHIIAHMNEGWANGHHYGIEYWEIWNEADGSGTDVAGSDCRTWGGTKEQFFELYEITARHLKAKFPHLKIGGPSVSHITPGAAPWTDEFLARVSERKIPLDFFSWHCYTPHVTYLAQLCKHSRALLDGYGLTQTESILNEWNYVRDFTGEGWIYSAEMEHGIKGAAFQAGCMSACQETSLDMLMYYDARPCAMNGIFHSDSYKPLKGYYPLKVWGEMLRMGTRCAVSCDIPDVYATAARGEDGTVAMITYYTDDDSASDIIFTVSVDDDRKYDLYLLDDTHDMTLSAKVYPCDGNFQLTMKPNTVIVLK